MRMKYALLGLITATCFMMGCGQEKAPDKSTMYIEKDGQIVDVSIADLSAIDFDATKLEAFVNTQLEQYNEEYEEDILLEEMETADETKVSVRLRYTNMEGYNVFNQCDYYAGDFDASQVKSKLISGKDGTDIEASQITDQGLKMLIFKQPLEDFNVECAGKVLYYSTSVTPSGAVYQISAETDSIIIYR